MTHNLIVLQSFDGSPAPSRARIRFDNQPRRIRGLIEDPTFAPECLVHCGEACRRGRAEERAAYMSCLVGSILK